MCFIKRGRRIGPLNKRETHQTRSDSGWFTAYASYEQGDCLVVTSCIDTHWERTRVLHHNLLQNSLSSSCPPPTLQDRKPLEWDFPPFLLEVGRPEAPISGARQGIQNAPNQSRSPPGIRIKSIFLNQFTNQNAPNPLSLSSLSFVYIMEARCSLETRQGSANSRHENLPGPCPWKQTYCTSRPNTNLASSQAFRNNLTENNS